VTSIKDAKWTLIRTKWLLDALESGRREVSDSDTFEGGVLSIGGEHIGWKGEWLLENPRYISREFFEAMNTGIVKKDDILLVKDGATIGKVAIANMYPGQDAAVNEHVFLLRFKESFHKKYYFYVLQSLFFQEQIQVEIRGAAQPGLNSAFKHSVYLPEPSLSEQLITARYLDRETAHIDALITEKERMLALLEEKRAALISQVVTRGLNPNVPLKLSGIDWLGDIPVHWDMFRVKYVIKSLDQGASPQAANIPAGPSEFGVLKLSAVSRGRFLREENKALKESDGTIHELALKKGDVLLTRGNTPELVGDVCFVSKDEPNLLLPDLIYRMRVREERILSQYLSCFLVTKESRVQIMCDARGSSGTMVKVSQGHVVDWRLPVPPLDEQQEIVNEIEEKQEKSSLLSNSLEESIELLKERRLALITAAVTGQVDPKDMAA